VSVSASCAAGLSGCAPCRLRRHGHPASIPHAFAPAALRAALASRGWAQGPSPPRRLGAPRYHRTGCAGSGRPVPRRNGRVGEHAGACCGRLCESVPSSTLEVLTHHVTKDGSRTARPASLWSFHATPQDRRRSVRPGRFRLSSGGWPGPRQWASRCSLCAGMPSRPCLRSVRFGPRRPCVVV